MLKQDSSDAFSSRADTAQIAAQKRALNQESQSCDNQYDDDHHDFITAVPAAEKQHPTTAAATDENSSKFYDGYMARVQALQEMTKEFNRELEAIEDSSDDSDKKPNKRISAPPEL